MYTRYFSSKPGHMATLLLRRSPGNSSPVAQTFLFPVHTYTHPPRSVVNKVHEWDHPTNAVVACFFNLVCHDMFTCQDTKYHPILLNCRQNMPLSGDAIIFQSPTAHISQLCICVMSNATSVSYGFECFQRIGF